LDDREETKKPSDVIGKPVHMELESLEELVRMVVASAPAEHASLFCFASGESFVFATLLILPGWLDLHSLPVLVFARTDQGTQTGRFIRYDIFDKNQRVEFVQSPNEKEALGGAIRFVPIVRIKHPPFIFGVP
jgi:hypothetical protein